MLPPIPFSRTITVTRLALSRTGRRLYRVFRIERMPVLTVRLGNMSTICAPDPSASFFGLRNGSPARATKAGTGLSDSRIAKSKLMAVATMGSGSVTGSGVSAPDNILSLRNGLKMGRVNAERVAAKVIKRFARIEWPILLLPNPAVSAHRSLSTIIPPAAGKGETSVKSAVGFLPPRCPKPTFVKIRGCFRDWPILVNLSPKSFKRFSVFSHKTLYTFPGGLS